MHEAHCVFFWFITYHSAAFVNVTEEKFLQGVKYLFCDQCVTVGLCFEGRHEQL